MKVYKLDFDKHGVRNAKKENIPNLINAEQPGFFKLTLHKKHFLVCGDLKRHGIPRVTGLSKRLNKAFLLDKLVIYKDTGLSDADVDFISKHIQEIVDIDFDKNYYALVGVENVEEL